MLYPMLRLRKTVLSPVLGLVFATAWPQQPSPAQVSAPSHEPARRAALIGVANFAQVSPQLYRGGQPHGTGLQSLKKLGINTIIDLRLSGDDTESAQVKKLGMEFVPLPWHCLFPKDDVIAKFLVYLKEHPKKKVFVHCRYGDDRTGMMIAAYRISAQGWTPAEARKEMNAFGFHHVLCSSLVGYEQTFPDRLKNNPAFQKLQAEK
jgi:protein tyrosine/serine phosphatase